MREARVLLYSSPHFRILPNCMQAKGGMSKALRRKHVTGVLGVCFGRG